MIWFLLFLWTVTRDENECVCIEALLSTLHKILFVYIAPINIVYMFRNNRQTDVRTIQLFIVDKGWSWNRAVSGIIQSAVFYGWSFLLDSKLNLISNHIRLFSFENFIFCFLYCLYWKRQDNFPCNFNISISSGGHSYSLP